MASDIQIIGGKAPVPSSSDERPIRTLADPPNLRGVAPGGFASLDPIHEQCRKLIDDMIADLETIYADDDMRSQSAYQSDW
jgi:hypothetical protein